jgi:hypothetical protein
MSPMVTENVRISGWAFLTSFGIRNTREYIKMMEASLANIVVYVLFRK